jgi:predicted TIM-barrel fold metal-dependent hydrolase
MTNAELGTALDGALKGLYDLCCEPAISAPVMAHGGEGNEAGQGYGARADPFYWLDVARLWPQLRISLAHFGGFNYQSAAPPTGLPPPLDTAWEGVIGAFVAKNPDRALFADLAYFSDVFNQGGAQRRAIAANFEFYKKLDPQMRHILFGSDWIMLGNLPNSDGYAGQIRDFLRMDCKLNDEQYANITWRNAVRFLGLQPGKPTRARLDRFYRDNQVDPQRLAVFDGTFA